MIFRVLFIYFFLPSFLSAKWRERGRHERRSAHLPTMSLTNGMLLAMAHSIGNMFLRTCGRVDRRGKRQHDLRNPSKQIVHGDGTRGKGARLQTFLLCLYCGRSAAKKLPLADFRPTARPSLCFNRNKSPHVVYRFNLLWCTKLPTGLFFGLIFYITV